MSTARPSRSTSAERIAAGASTDPMNLPDATGSSRPAISGAIPQTAQLVSSMEDLEDNDNADTQPMWIRDADLFETGGLNKSDPFFLKKYQSGFKKKKFTAIAYMPSYEDVIVHGGSEYEFLGYIGDDIEVEEEELASFQGYNDEYSEFFGKFFKKVGKGLKKVGKFAKKAGSAYLKVSGLGLAGKGLKAVFRKKKSAVGFDGMQEVEYFFGPDPAEAEFFGKMFKAIGKGVKKAVKAVGKGVKNAVKATGKGLRNATKWTGKTIEKGADYVVNSAAKIMGGGGGGEQEGASEYESPLAWSQGTAAMDMAANPQSFMPYNDNQQYETDAGGQPVYGSSASQSSVAPAPAKNNTILIVSIIAAVVILGGLFIYKSK